MSQFAKTPVTGRAAAVKAMLTKDVLSRAYSSGMNLSRFLETLDPTEAHTRPTTDAFNRVLRACGIRTRSVPELGIRASTLEEVVNHPQAQFLAVELFARAYRGAARPQLASQRAPITSLEGLPGSLINQFAFPAARSYLLEPAVSLAEVVGQTTGINSTYYRPFFMEDVVNATSRVAEAAEVPAVRISTSEKTITLKKYGRRIDVTYESLRTIPIDMLSFYIQRIAVKVEAEKVDKVVDVIVNGDGSAGSTATNYNVSDLNGAAAGTTFNLEAWLAFKMKFKNPLMLTTVLARDTNILQLMLLNTGSANIPLVMMGGLFAQQSVTPINNGLADGVRAGWLDSPPAGKLVAFDKRLSTERIFEVGGTIQETDKDIKTQINTLVLTEVEGYAVLDPQANKTLDLTA